MRREQGYTTDLDINFSAPPEALDSYHKPVAGLVVPLEHPPTGPVAAYLASMIAALFPRQDGPPCYLTELCTSELEKTLETPANFRK
ncbi:transmembrane protein 250 isoform X2 [Eublepharis macularius]|uniref:Transmembrane protein 250 isoform X2 n=1 Tax=Eublepharis macularius TaxID=481883 RepID=A0AA97LFJ7_EUBMA|nr:transmembrane protein 250 isoform X2 [Eublepharis macularius]